MQINKISNVLKSRCGVWTHPAVPALLGCYWDVNSAVVPLTTVRRRLKKPLPFSSPEKVSLPVSFDLFNFRPLKAPKEVQQKAALFISAVEILFKCQSCFILQTVRWQPGNLEASEAPAVVELPAYPNVQLRGPLWPLWLCIRILHIYSTWILFTGFAQSRL